MKKNYKPRELALIASFGTLWGVIEISLGSFLKGFKIPLSGVIMGCVSVSICLIGFYFIRRKGAIFLMGCLAALIKIFSTGVVILSPSLAILIEALIADTVIRIFGVKRFSYLLTGILVVGYPLIHPLIAQGLIFGTDIYTIYMKTFRAIGLEQVHLIWAILFILILHMSAGMMVGLFSYRTALKVELEINRRNSNK